MFDFEIRLPNDVEVYWATEETVKKNGGHIEARSCILEVVHVYFQVPHIENALRIYQEVLGLTWAETVQILAGYLEDWDGAEFATYVFD